LHALIAEIERMETGDGAQFDAAAFEALMARGVQLQAADKVPEAREARLNAYAMAPELSMERGRAARDIAFGDLKSGNLRDGAPFAQEAYDIHTADSTIDNADSTSGALREAAASSIAMAVYSYALGGAAAKARAHFFVGEYSNHLRESKSWQERAIDRRIDQYQINSQRRASAVETLTGHRARGLALAVGGMAIAGFSESPLLSTANPNIGLKDRLKTKGRVFAAGALAAAVAVTATPAPTRRRAWAERQAAKLW
jgi:hypothetical protein